MDAQDNVKDVASRQSASPAGLGTDMECARSALRSPPNALRSSPPQLAPDVAMDVEPANNIPRVVDDAKSDSEAETIVLPGKDGHSPSKKRKSIKHEDQSEDEEMKDAPAVSIAEHKKTGDGHRENRNGEETATASHSKTGGRASETIAASMLGKRKRAKHGNGNVLDDRDRDAKHMGNSSGLSSVPTSPVATTRSSLSKPAASESDNSRSPSPPPRSRSVVRDKAKSVDTALSRREQYASASGEDEEGVSSRFNRLRSPGTDQRLHPAKRSSSKSHLDSNPRKRTRSTSPHSRNHRRSISTQFPSKSSSSHGLSHKKKRVPAPLQSTEYHSDESSASGSSHPRSSRLRSLAAPTTGESATSPAKMPPHKKHVNSSGQTLLARACQKGALEVAKQRLEERPQDLNEPDHALNTPLHMASIRGHANVVRFLLDKHCIVDSVNDSKDTPLHDAIENGHVEVVKLLLGAGANPNKPNRRGDEPLDLVALNEEDESYEGDEAAELRAAITSAKQNNRGVRRSSEDEQMHDKADNHSSRHKESPRRSPPVFSHETQGSARSRVRTARSYKTGNDYLYQDLGPNELRKAAMEGNVEVAARVLEVNPTLKDTESLYLAAKGGHSDVINILFAMGGFDPDPTPLKGIESSTPILAAIGRDAHLKVLELLLSQDAFDPTRRIEGETYYEIARERAGPRSQEEEKLLKDAFEKYETNRKSSGKPRSPGLRRDGREVDRDARKLAQRDEQQTSSLHMRTASSPKSRGSEPSKGSQRDSLSSNHTKDGLKRGPGRPRKEETTSSAILSDRDTTPLGPPKQKSHIKRSESEAGASENDAVTKPRRKLVSGKDLRGERELELQKQRRTSVASNASSASIKDKRGPGESKREKSDGRVSPSVPRISKPASSNQYESDITSEKSSDKDRARSLKRDDSKDRLSAIRGDSPVKRPRKSATPPRSGMQEVTNNFGIGGGPQKRRKLEGDASTVHKADSTSSSSPDIKTTKAKSNNSNESGGERSRLHPKTKHSQNADTTTDDPSKHLSPGEKRAKSSKQNSSHSIDPISTKHKPASAGSSDHSEEDAVKAAKLKEEKAKKAEARREEELEANRRKALEEKLEDERIEKARLARIAREEAQREEDAKRLQEEAERKERQKAEDAAAHARAMEDQRALYVEQERLKREEQERRRALLLKQQAAERARIEEEKRVERLSRLPLLFRWFDLFDDPKTQEVASLFRGIDGYRYDTIRPEATGQPNAREQWMLNAHAAILLGEKDLQLSRYTAWERIPLSEPAKKAVWKTKNGDFTLREPRLAGFGRAFPSNGEPPHIIVEKNKSLFIGLDLFFVKVSEFMFIVPNFPHLRSIEMLVNYKELDTSFKFPPPPSKWKQDSETDPNQQFAPQPKIYLNGQCIRQQDTPMTRLSHEPPSNDRRVPRRELVPVYPHEADYEELCRKQGLTHLLPFHRTPPSSSRHEQPEHHEQANGFTPPRSDRTKSINGGSPHRGSMSEPELHQLLNGVNEHTDH
ncbi:Protein HOS4 [Lachnellula cervina]|uniref:Protein HOS4 n=1 Tax=Lachnellula cervina TaxID=1316786 RepID=A0A7D8YXK1_9HELO|nr:Protein HOS4 [Lachnellula cervina]